MNKNLMSNSQKNALATEAQILTAAVYSGNDVQGYDIKDVRGTVLMRLDEYAAEGHVPMLAEQYSYVEGTGYDHFAREGIFLTIEDLILEGLIVKSE